MAKTRGRPLDVQEELLESFDHCLRVTEFLVGLLPARVWRADPPAGRRPIAAIAAHMQSVRRTFIRMGGGPALPAMDRATVTPARARRDLRESREALNGQLRDALARGDARVKGMPRRAVNMMVYLVQHEAHHRGQITTLARALGHEFAGSEVTKIWGWRKL